MAKKNKLSAGWILKRLLARLFNPRHIFQMIKIARGKGQNLRSAGDAQLSLYSKILPADFLHYGYFENPQQHPSTISLADIAEAQLRYAQLILEKIDDKDAPVLDVGCGSGGLLNLLKQNGFNPVGLTPDGMQIDYIKRKYPDTDLIQSKYGRLNAENYPEQFGTVINSESLQYIKLDKAFAVTDKILKKGGKWIIVDYFRMASSAEKSGHKFENFIALVDQYSFSLSCERDITEHILPTLSYVHYLGENLGLPLYEFLTGKLGRKNPVLHYLIEDVNERAKSMLGEYLDLVDPQKFRDSKKYILLVLEKRTSD